MENYNVSGCIVTYNNKDIIGRTVSNILEMTKGVDFRLFVVDNCSSDGTAEYIEENFPAVTVIRARENRGFGAGHNKVLPFVSSKYHVVINPDILLKDDVISELCAYADGDEEIGLVSPQIRYENGEIQPLGKKNPTFRYLGAHRVHNRHDGLSKTMIDYCMLDKPQDEPFEITNATGCFMFFRTNVFKALGGFDERFFMYLEDCDIARRVSEKYKAVHYPTASVYHLWERESKKSKKLLLIHVKSILTYFLKWGFKL